MRRGVIAFAAMMAVAPAASGADCNGEVLSAFEKQRTSKAFRVTMEQPTAEGDIKMTIDYIPPSKMLQTVVSPAMPGDQQTMLDGERAYSGSNGVWEELLPQFTQSIVAEVRTALGAPSRNPGEFDCLGKVAYDGKDLLGFRTKPLGDAAASGEGVTRTIYVDPGSGLPAYNVIATLKAPETPVAKVVYSYPGDIVIEAPVGAPVQKLRH